jgi:putative flippase GtrA
MTARPQQPGPAGLESNKAGSWMNRLVIDARAQYRRFRVLIHEFAKFGVIGVGGLVITNGGYDLLHNHGGMGPVTATTIATIVATIVAYVGNRYWSFRHRERAGVARETVVFFLLNGIGLLIQDAAVWFNYYVVGLGHNKVAEFVALNVGIAAATVFRFWSYRKWVWLAPAPSPDSPDVDTQVLSPSRSKEVG